MSEYDDDLAGWADDDLVRALRAPGTAEELADEEQVLAAFRSARPVTGIRSLPRRAAGRLGAGGTAVVVTVALTSGVAAAYTGNLPDPVQRVVHSVLGPIGAPAPEAGGPTHVVPSDPRRSHATDGPSTTPGSTPSSPLTSAPGSPTGAPSSAPTGSPSDGGHHGHHTGPSTGPSSGTTGGPSGGPSSSPSTPPTVPAAAMSIAGTEHRVGVGQSVTLTGVVSDAGGLALSDHGVTLLVRGPHRWRAIATATSDTAGSVSFTTPPLQRSARFRLRAEHRVRSTPWPVRMVPALSTAVSVGSTSTTISGSCQGCHGGDPVLLYRIVDHQARLVRHARLDPSGSLLVQVVTPQRTTRFAVRLLPTRRHAAVHARVTVVPPAAATVSIGAAGHRVPVGQSVTLSGVVQAADGSPLPGRRVALQVRGPHRWRLVGRATTDASGSVSFATPAARRTTGYRLRTANGAHSIGWRLVMVPTLTAGATPDPDTVGVTATAQGGRAGDRVVLFRRVGTRLVRLRHGPLAPDGTVTFQVPHRRRDTTYVVRLLGTHAHAPATTQVAVAGTG